MKFKIMREDLLLPLQQVIGVIERRQTLPILANVLICVNSGRLELTGTDLEIQLVATSALEDRSEGRFTVPARKLMDICRLLPEQSVIGFDVRPDRVILQCGKSRFALGALPAENYPDFDHDEPELQFTCDVELLRVAIEKTAFAMAQQDVRYYLNGLLLEVDGSKLRTVASDGHRLALFEEMMETGADVPASSGASHAERGSAQAESVTQVIVPRKGVTELARLLAHAEGSASIGISPNHIRVVLPERSFSAKLIEGRYPDYQRVIPRSAERVVIVNRADFRTALTRVAVLSSEKFKGVSLEIEPGLIRLKAHNPEHEEAEDEIGADFAGENFVIGFNASYLLDAVNVVDSDSVRLSFTEGNGSCLVEDVSDPRFRFVVMPMRL